MSLPDSIELEKFGFYAELGDVGADGRHVRDRCAALGRDGEVHRDHARRLFEFRFRHVGHYLHKSYANCQVKPLRGIFSRKFSASNGPIITRANLPASAPIFRTARSSPEASVRRTDKALLGCARYVPNAVKRLHTGVAAGIGVRSG